MLKKYLSIAFLIKALVIICISFNHINAMQKHSLKLRKFVPLASTLIKRDCSSSFKLPESAQALIYVQMKMIKNIIN